MSESSKKTNRRRRRPRRRPSSRRKSEAASASKEAKSSGSKSSKRRRGSRGASKRKREQQDLRDAGADLLVHRHNNDMFGVQPLDRDIFIYTYTLRPRSLLDNYQAGPGVMDRMEYENEPESRDTGTAAENDRARS